MGSCSSSGMFSGRNKEFQSVVPFPNDGVDANQGSKKRKLSPQKASKTAPSPISEDPPEQRLRRDLSAGGTELEKSQKFNEPLSGPSISAAPKTDDTVPVNTSVDSNFLQTESQQRRERMADCEFECSRITSYLYVAGYHVATNREMLRLNGVTHIINCSAAVVENAFIEDKSLKYLSLSMVDGRQDDISWFLCEVVQFIMKARALGGKVLVHCEKGISRSCSFAIAYRMWATGDKWKVCFDFVKKGRSICSSNTAFTCNLIELGELLGKDAAKTGAGGNLLFRCAYHLPHDPKTAVLKLCRTADSRKIMTPASSLLDPKGVFILRTVTSTVTTEAASADQHRLFLWQGAEASDHTARKAESLARKMHGVLTTTDKVEWVKQGEETFQFLSYLVEDGVFNPTDNTLFDDFYDYPPSEETTQASIRQMEADHTRNNDTFRIPTPARESSIKGFAEYTEGPMSREMSRDSSIRSQVIIPQLSRESSTRRGSGVGADVQALLSRRASGTTMTMSTDGASKETISTVATNGPPSASRSLLGRGSSDSRMEGDSPSTTTANSRRNSDYVTPFTRIPSIQLTEQMPSIEESRSGPPTLGTAAAGSPDPTKKPRNVPELALALKHPLTQMQRVSEGEMNTSDLSSSRMNSSRDHSARDPASEIRGAVMVSADGTVTPRVVVQKQLSGSKIVLPALALSKTTSPKPADLALSIGSTPPKSATSSMAKLSKLPLPGAGAEGEPPMLTRQGSEDKVPSPKAAGAGAWAGAGAGQEGLHGSSRPTSSGVGPNGQSPQAETRDRRLSGAAASMLALGRGTSSNTNSAANLHAALPLKVLERSPSQERHPQDVGLSRGPTPIEDLMSPRDHTYSHQTNLLLPAQVDPAYMQRCASKQGGVVALVKPLLFQAVLKEIPDIPRPGRKAGGATVRYEWQAMGVYDDEDLDETSLLILLCPSKAHKIWVGAAFAAAEAGMEVDGDEPPSAESVLKWAARVLPGEVRVEGVVGSHLLSNSSVAVEMGGEESEAFWQDFNDGY